MGTISSTLDRPLRTAAVIGTEDEAIMVTHTIANLFGRPSGQGDTAETRLALLSRSGLLGISVPTDDGGIDVSNTVLAAVCSDAALHSSTLGNILAAHFGGIELLRSYGTEGQRKTVFAAALAGARLARGVVRAKDNAEALPLVSNGLAWRLAGEALCTPCTRHADWLLLPTQNGGRTTCALLPTRIEGLRYVANSCEPANGAPQPAEHVLFKDVVLEGDVLLHAAGDVTPPPVARSLELLLDAAQQLGAARASLWRLLNAGKTSPLVVGYLSSRLAATEAMIAEAGRAIDAAQIGLADHNRTNAFLAAVSALSAAQESEQQAEAAIRGDDVSRQLAPHVVAALAESGMIVIEAHAHPPEDGE